MTINWEISKQFDFCYGHRVHNQKLDPELSLDSCLACRHIHGHQGTILIHLTSGQLKSGMVTDFKHLNWFSKWLDETLDHKFIMDKADPVLSTMFPLATEEVLKRNLRDHFWTPDLTHPVFNDLAPCVKEIYEGLILVNFVPTSECICMWLSNIVRDRMSNLSVRVSKIEFKETPRSNSTIHLV